MKIGAYLIILCIPTAITIFAFPTPEHYKKHLRHLQNSAYAYRSIPAMYGVPGQMIFDLAVGAEHLSPQEEKETMAFINSLPHPPALPDSVSPPKNVVVILCESLESWVIGMEWQGKPVTPNLTRWASLPTSYYDPHVLSQARDGRSIDGQLLIFTGLLPMASGTYATQVPKNYFPSIHKALKQINPDTRATLITGDKPYVWNQAEIARSFGMDTLVTFLDFDVTKSYTGRRHLPDVDFAKQTVEKLRKGDLLQDNRHNLLQLVTYSGHGPFRLPDELKTFTSLPGTPTVFLDYINVAHYTDEALGILISYLQTLPDWKQTMVLITGDHEGLAGWRTEVMASEQGKKYASEKEYVPLLILNSPLPDKSEKEIGQVDIYSTLLHLTGTNAYHWPGLGHSALTPQSKDYPQTLTPQTASDRILRFNLLKPQ